MILLAVVLVLFLLAFAGLAVALIFGRKGLRGGCGHPGADDCRCKPAPKSAPRDRDDPPDKPEEG